MMNYGLPTSVEVNGVTYKIRSDYRAVLDICTALTDPELNNDEKVITVLDIFYEDFDSIPIEDYQEAIDRCFRFINCDTDEPQRKAPKLVDWEQDFQYIVAPINRVVGKEIRAVEYMHWWSFISAYYEIGADCLFAQIVQIRDKRARGKKLEKYEQEWLRNNRHLVDFKRSYTTAEDELLKAWT